MGRASRKQHWTETHPDRKMWSPGRLAVARTQTQEEYEALYGRSSATDLSRSVYSPLFGRVSAADISSLEEGFSDARDRIRFLSRIQGMFSREEFEKDPVLEALWKGEWNLFCKSGIAKVAQTQEENLRNLWYLRIVSRALKQDPSGRLCPLEPDLLQKTVGSGPHSVLGTAMEAGLRGEIVAEDIRKLRQQNPDAAREYFDLQLLPEMDYLAGEYLVRRGGSAPRVPPSEELCREIWQFLPEATGINPAYDPAAILQAVKKMWRGDGPEDPLLKEASHAATVYPFDARAIYREFFAVTGNWSGRPLQATRDMLEMAGDDLLAQYVKALYRNGRTLTEMERSWTDHKLLGSPENPVQCLAPLFEKDDVVFRDLLADVRSQQKRGRLPNIDSAIDRVASVSGIQNFPEALAREIHRDLSSPF